MAHDTDVGPDHRDESWLRALSLSLSERTVLRRLVDRETDVGAARVLGVSRTATLRALAGLRIRRGTAVVIRQELARLALDTEAAE